MNVNEIFPSWNEDYVDIHGRSLNIMVDDDGSIFVPFHEIRRTGFHIFPRSNYQHQFVGKSLIMREFHLHMLGAAQDYMIQNNVHSLSRDDIIQTIELCKEELLSTDKQNDVGHTGTLGRTLLSNPVNVTREIKNVVQNNFQRVTSEERITNFHSSNNRQNQVFDKRTESSNNALRRPKQNLLENSESSSNSANVKKVSVQNENIACERNSTKSDTFNNRSKQNNKKSESFSGNSDNGDRDFVRLSDLKFRRIELDTKMQKVKVVHIEDFNEKEKYWVQLEDKENDVVEILTKINNCDKKEYVTTSPKLGEMYMAISNQDDVMYRVAVLSIRPVGIKVHFIDFGNTEVVKNVYRLPDNLSKIPAQAVRIIISRPPDDSTSPQKLKVDQVISVKYLKEFQDKTILVHTEESFGKKNNVSFEEKRRIQKESSPEEEQVFMPRLKFSTELKVGEMVKIVSEKNGKFYLRNRENHKIYVDILNHIKELPKCPLKSYGKNQLVLCKKDREEEMCRAIIENIDDGLANVRFVDFQMPDTVSLKTLRSVSKATAQMPVALIESPCIKGYQGSFSDEALALMEHLISNNIKLKVVSVNPEFDLMHNNESLSKLLFPNKKEVAPSVMNVDLKLKSEKSQSPPPPSLPLVQKEQQPQLENNRKDVEVAVAVASTSKKVEVVTPEKYIYPEMKSYNAPIGLGDYMLMCYSNPMELNLVSTEQEVTEMLAKVTAIEISEDDDATKIDYDNLELSDMVLVKYQGDWYRGVISEADKEPYGVMLVDYGNELTVKKEDLRKFPKHLVEIPMLSMMCSLDLKLNEAASKRLKEILVIEDIYQINILSFDPENLYYNVRMPKIEALLAKEGLL